MLGLAGAWVAAGDAGLLGHPLRHALTWLALGAAAVVHRPAPRRSWPARGVLALALLVAVGLLAPPWPAANVLAVALVLAALAVGDRDVPRRVLVLGAVAVAVLGVWCLARTSIGSCWLVADAAGTAIGRVAAMLFRQPLSVGATFAGLDYLVVMLVFYAGRLQMPVLMFAGEKDHYRDNCCTADNARNLAAAAKAAGKPFDLDTYPKAEHDFVRGGEHYNAEADSDAFQKTSDRLKQLLPVQ